MKIQFFGTVMTLVISSMLLFSALAFAAEPQSVTIEGWIMDWNLKKNMIVVNEKYFFWDAQTLFYNEAGTLIKPEQLKMNTLVNIEAVKNRGKREFLIKKLSFLPPK